MSDASTIEFYLEEVLESILDFDRDRVLGFLNDLYLVGYQEGYQAGRTMGAIETERLIRGGV